MKRISKESVEKMQQTEYLWYWQTNIAVLFLLKVFWMSFLLGLPVSSKPYFQVSEGTDREAFILIYTWHLFPNHPHL